LDGANYTYDAAGNQKSRQDNWTGINAGYAYDALYELTQVTQGATTTESYTYDAVGNRLSSLGLSPYNYGISNELLSKPGVNFTYDSNGNTLSKSDSTGTTTYGWDFENRLASVTLPGTGGTVTFKYDPFGRRVQKSSPSGTTNYLFDGLNVLEEVDNSGNVLARYTQSDETDEALSELRTGTTTYYEQDGIGAVTSLSNSAATLANTYRYDSYGKLTASTGTVANPFQYTGREFDSETGIYAYRARYYDQNVGRFLSEDPIAFNGGLNFYRYVYGNPLTLVDPLAARGGKGSFRSNQMSQV